MSEIAAIIGGTGIYKVGGLDLYKETVKTPYGDVTIERTDDLVFINRHAPNHSVPPHMVNYRAHIKALDILGVKRICAAYAVGCLNEDFTLAVPIILDDFIDFTSGRRHTFNDEIKNAIGHVDMSIPFCPVLSAALAREASSIKMDVRDGGVYGACNGPRFESPAEIRAYRRLGCDVVGMTLCPELPLALELGMSFSALAFSINWGAGMTPTIELISGGVEETKTNMLRVMISALASTKNKDCTPAAII